VGFNVTCSPGKDATAGMVRITSEFPALILYLDPVNIAIQLPPFPDGAVMLARFCRELSREATRLAEVLEPSDQGGDQHAGA
jgi:hypothetical protein